MTNLTIYGPDATTIVRVTQHPDRASAVRSIQRYERRHGRHAHSIDEVPMPATHDAQGWDDYRQSHGIGGR